MFQLWAPTQNCDAMRCEFASQELAMRISAIRFSAANRLVGRPFVVSRTGRVFRKRKMDRKKIIALLLLLNRYKRKRRFWVHPFITIMNSDGNYFTQKYYALRTEGDKFFD